MNHPNQGRFYTLAAGLTRSAWRSPYHVPTNEPNALRKFNVYALDPSISRHNGSVACINVPREERPAKGPKTQLFNLDLRDPDSATEYDAPDIDDLEFVQMGSLNPDPADPKFHAQMVYAISLLTYESFRKALGRHIQWAFHGEHADDPAPLNLRPFAMQDTNAYYSRQDRSVNFGYRQPKDKPEQLSDRQTVFTSLSSDIITHEVTHALLDGLRPYFSEPSNPDVDALHEALADLVALFQRYTYTDLVSKQLQKLGGKLSGPTLLRVIAPQLGDAIGAQRGLRVFDEALHQIETSVLGADNTLEPTRLDTLSAEESEQPHARGRVLAEAIFDAFQTILNRKLEPIISLATRESGIVPEGNIPGALLDQIVRTTGRTAAQFLTICIRAIDYCPPVHVEFGDYLRALITADTLLVKSDRFNYREAIITACMIRGIYPRYVSTPSESSLNWNGPQSGQKIQLKQLALNNLEFHGDPAIPESAAEVERQACLFGEALANTPSLMHELGLQAPDSNFKRPEIVSVRSSRRVGPDEQVGFDLIIEVVQFRWVNIAGQSVPMRGGATVVLDPWGMIRFIIRKRVDQPNRLDDMKSFLGDKQNAMQLHRMRTPDHVDFSQLCFNNITKERGDRSGPSPMTR